MWNIFIRSGLVLTDEQTTWVKTASETVYKLLRETPPDGETFAKSIEVSNCLVAEKKLNRCSAK